MSAAVVVGRIELWTSPAIDKQFIEIVKRNGKTVIRIWRPVNAADVQR